MVFIAAARRGEPRPQEGEIHDARWWTTVPENVHTPADRLVADRLE